MKKIKLLALSIICLIFLGAVTQSLAQAPRTINWERMQRDLDIMEGVLSKLLLRAPHHWEPLQNNVHGLYFEGYGVVFQVDYGGLQVMALTPPHLEKSIMEMEKRVQEFVPENSEEPMVVAPEIPAALELVETFSPDRVERVKEQVTEFLANYADAIGQLEPSEFITVIVNLDRGRFFVFPPGHKISAEKKNTAVAILEINSKKSAIISYRQGKSNFGEFRQQIAFNERADDENMNKNIDIMANILETALSRKHREGFYVVDKNRGIYLKGLGTLFFMKAELGSDWPTPMAIVIDKQTKKRDVVQVKADGKKKSNRKTAESLNDFKDALLELVGDYGHTLRTLEPTEYVVVAVDFNSWNFGDDQPSRFIIKAQKKDLDNYNRGTMKLAEFKQSVQFLEY